MKYRLHKRSGQMVPDKPVPPGCPAHYGAVLNTVSADGEPLDAFVIGEPTAKVGQVLHASVAGCLLRADGDHKLLMTAGGAAMDQEMLDSICTWASQFETITGLGSPATAIALARSALASIGEPRVLPPTWIQKASESTRLKVDTLHHLINPRAPLILMPDAQYDEPFLGGVPVPVPMELGWVLPFCLERSQDGFRMLSTNVQWDDLRPVDFRQLALELDRVLGPDSPERIELSQAAHLDSVFTQGTLEPGRNPDDERIEPILPLLGGAWQPAEHALIRRLLGSAGEWGHCLEVGRFTQGVAGDQPLLRPGQVNVVIHLGSRFLWPLMREEVLRKVAYRSAQHTSTRHAALAGFLPLPYWDPEMAAFLDRFYAGMRFGQANREAVQRLVGQAFERVLPGARVSLISDTHHVALEPVVYHGEPVLLHRNGQHRVSQRRLAAILGGIGAPTAVVQAGPEAVQTEGLVPHGNPEPERALRTVAPGDPAFNLFCNTEEHVPPIAVSRERSRAFIADLVDRGLVNVVAWSEPIINLRGRKRDQSARIYGGGSVHP